MKKIFNKKNILIGLYALFISFICLSVASKNSFLYPFNDWVDANAFFTVGKSMMHGIVPYRDLFEQKGPLLYLIYGIGSLISFKSFLGIFILEVLFWTVALIYLYKILKLFLSTRVSLLILPIFMSLIVTTRAFTHGGSAEEFCVPFFFITLYYFIKHFKVKELTKKEMLLNGVIAGFILLIKYTLLGFWFGFTLAIFIDYIMQKDYKKALAYSNMNIRRSPIAINYSSRSYIHKKLNQDKLAEGDLQKAVSLCKCNTRCIALQKERTKDSYWLSYAAKKKKKYGLAK